MCKTISTMTVDCSSMPITTDTITYIFVNSTHFESVGQILKVKRVCKTISTMTEQKSREQ